MKAVIFVAVLFLFAFLVRLAFVLWLRELSVGPEGDSSADAVQFNVLAENLAAGNGFGFGGTRLTSFRAPGFPLVLAALYKVAGVNFPLAYLLLCALGALTCVLAYFLAREFLSEDAARWAGVLASLYLGHIWFATVFFSENLAAPLLILGILFFIRYLRSGRTTLLALSGVILGFGALTRPFGLLLLPFLGLPLVLHSRRGNRVAVAVLVYAAAFLLPIVPWTLRNYRVHGRLVPIATNGGSTFYGGNNDKVLSRTKLWGSWVATTELPGRPLIDQQPNEYSHDRKEWELGIQWVRDNPVKATALAGLKAIRLVVWWPDFDGGNRWYYFLRIVSYLPILGLILIGFGSALRSPSWRDPPWWVLHMAIIATLITGIMFAGLPRFRDTNVGLLMVYAALGLSATRRIPTRDD